MVERVEGDQITIRAIFDRYDEEFWTMSRDRARELGMTDLDFSERVILKIRIDSTEHRDRRCPRGLDPGRNRRDSKRGG